MNYNMILTLLIAMLSVVISCENPDLTDPNENQEQTGNDNKPSEGEGEGETESVKSMTITVERVSATKVVFKGTTKKTAPDIEVGIYWSKVQGSHINDCEKVSTYKITNGSFELVIDDLDADTKYYCYPYLFMNGARELGDEFDFKTAQPKFTIDNVSVDIMTVTFTGYADHDCSVGIYCSTSSPSGYNYKTHHSVNAEDNNYTLTLDKLSSSTTYYYCTYVKEGSNGNPTYGAVKSFTTENPTITIDNVSVSNNQVTFTGNAKLDCEGGILYSTTPSISKDNCLGVIDLSKTVDSFTQKLTLSMGVSYYYCTYYWNNATKSYSYGEIKSFKTKDVSLLINGVSVVDNKVTFDGYVELDCEGGILYSTVSEITKDNYSGQINLSNKTGSFTQTATLSMDMTFYYCTYYYSNATKSYIYGDVKNVKAPFQWSLAKNLSASESANCYIVSTSGLYKIKAVKGNSETSVGAVFAEVLWESFGTSVVPSVGDIVQYVACKDNYIGFKIPDNFKEGNAVIAAKDADGNILWSWHIWLTDQPQEHVYYNNAGTMMDRNLGATSATPGDVGALGLLYQWGRKDPFLGSSSISSSTLAKSTITWPSAVNLNSSYITTEYTIAHPTTYLYDKVGYNKGTTLWTTSDKAKSIYDPCPAGWRVPDGGDDGVWSKACDSSSYFKYTYDSTNEGMNFGSKFGDATTIWYPASGRRGNDGGSLLDVGYSGIYWSASPNSDYSNCAYYLFINYDGYVYPSYYYYRALGQSVRCLQESK